MVERNSIPSTASIMDAMIDLTRLCKSHRVSAAGPSALDLARDLHERGFWRVATTATCRIPCGQHDVGLVAGRHSMQALEALLLRIVPFLNARATVAVWVDAGAGQHGGKKLQLLLERLGFRIEAGARCENGVVVSAQRREWSQVANAA